MDHGILNIPLSKRGNIDAEIDRYKAQQQAATKQRAQRFREKQDQARSLVAAMTDGDWRSLAEKAGLTIKQAQKKLRSMARFEPTKVISALVVKG